VVAVIETAHRRFALAVVANLEDALTITQHLLQRDLEPQLISVIGQEASFAGERQNAAELSRIVSRSAATPSLMIDSNRIVALTRDCDTPPKEIAKNADSFEKMLLKWLSPQHGERLAGAVARGEFLLLVELHSMVDERVATRILLRNCRGSVEVHDVDTSAEQLRL
jgi:hypothetical protein